MLTAKFISTFGNNPVLNTMPVKSLLLFLLLPIVLNAQSPERKLFLVAGQSNAVGVGNADSSVSCNPGTCFEYITTGNYLKPLKDPVGYNAVNEDFMAALTGSMWPSFANTYNQLTGDTVILVQAAKGGTSCAAAADGGAGNWSSAYHLFEQTVAKAKAAEAYTGLQLSGVIWMQGESDAVGIQSNKISACQYEDALNDLIARFRNALRCNLPFYIVQTGLYTPVYDNAFYLVRDVQQQVAHKDPLSFIVDSLADTYRSMGWMNGDQIHLNQKALNNTGAIAAQNVVHFEQTTNLDSCYARPQPILSPDWAVYPSPFKDELLLEIRNCDCADIELRISDMLGRTVYHTQQTGFVISQPVLNIPTSALQRGAYVVHVRLNKQWTLTKKVIKQ